MFSKKAPEPMPTIDVAEHRNIRKKLCSRILRKVSNKMRHIDEVVLPRSNGSVSTYLRGLPNSEFISAVSKSRKNSLSKL